MKVEKRLRKVKYDMGGRFEVNKVFKTLMCCVLFLLFGSQAFAQQTSSGLKGVVLSGSGEPLESAEVIIKNNSGISRTVTTDSDGTFSLRNLPVGGGFTVEVAKEGYTPKKVEDISVNLGRIVGLDIVLDVDSGGTEQVQVLEEISVVAKAIVNQVAAGQNATFDLSVLESAPAINRDITDVLRTDSRIYINEADENQVQCAGKNPRFNSLTVDGVRLNDSFGLNRNGYPTERIPFSFDAIEQVAVELAPFDVEYGGFTACNINAVTKSGTNEIHGSVFYDFGNDSLRGDKLEGDSLSLGSYSEERYGINVGGPIIKDKLFFFAALEKLEGADLFDRGPIGSGAVNEVNVTQAELDEISQIARDIYGYDPGGIISSRANGDEKALIKLDWYINDNHRAALNYTYNDGFSTREADRDSNEFEFSNHLYEKGAELNSIVGTLYSTWNENFSTEVRFGKLDLDDTRTPLGGTDFGEVRVELDNVNVFLGADDSRHATNIDYTVDSFAFKGAYFLGEHELSFGLEREAFDVDNLFVQHTETELRFRGIQNFREGRARAIYYNNAPSGNPEDAAARWGFALNTVYFQDKFRPRDDLEIVAGLRYDVYTSSDKPLENQDFVASYGFSNSANLDGEGLLQPRFAFTYDMSDSTRVQGGLGLYSGGNPNVWLSNNFSSNNVLQFGQRGRNFGYRDRSLFDADVSYEAVEAGAPNGPGYGVPSELFNAVAAGEGANFEINYLDPNFEIPSDLKIALGVNHVTGGDYTWDANLLVSRAKDSAIVLRADIDQVGTNARGYPIYESNREPAFVLTNSDKDATSVSASFGVSKEHENGWSWSVGYAYSDAKDIQPMHSAVAFTNYTERAFFDPQEQVASTSNFNVEHRLTLNARYEKYFFKDNLTTISFFGSSNSGRNYSLAFDGTRGVYGFTPFLDGQNSVLEAGTQRNSETGPSWTRVDMRVEQEVPGFSADHKASVFFTIANLTNLLNDDWGIANETGSPYLVDLNGSTPIPRVGDASRYEIRIGAKYDF